MDLAHPNILTCLGGGKDDGGEYVGCMKTCNDQYVDEKVKSGKFE